mmetsp:Transcript_5223/g.7986  ORF Transcript_5223/g.7986 Transcript_5223/m.7986 type:complete len:167 (-) Transcript_5223:1478-1978(-)
MDEEKYEEKQPDKYSSERRRHKARKSWHNFLNAMSQSTLKELVTHCKLLLAYGLECDDNTQKAVRMFEKFAKRERISIGTVGEIPLYGEKASAVGFLIHDEDESVLNEGRLDYIKNSFALMLTQVHSQATLHWMHDIKSKSSEMECLAEEFRNSSFKAFAQPTNLD